MCDTQILIKSPVTWFAKNSDREPGEPQVIVRHQSVTGDTNEAVQTTYLRIPQVPDRHAVVLSKPAWIWGAEMGINDRGVVIGNEAIFSRRVSSEKALLGMDLVRLGLERASSATAAVEVMTSLLETWGQGGPAGFRDKSFCYDNSFIVADARDAYVLETAGRDWVRKRIDRFHAISNCLTIADDYDAASVGVDDLARRMNASSGSCQAHEQTGGAADKSNAKLNFARQFDTRLLPFFGRAHDRVALASRCLAAASGADVSFATMASHLRKHAHETNEPLRGSNADLCMHAAGLIRRSQTCGSMVARLEPGDVRVMLTGTSAPCLSLFAPVSISTDVGSAILFDESNDVRQSIWYRHEPLHRRALFDAGLRDHLRRSRHVAEEALFRIMDADAAPGRDDYEKANRVVADWHEARRDSIEPSTSWHPPLTPAGLFWRRRTAEDGIGS